MSAKIIFSCDHFGCSATYTLDSGQHECTGEHTCGGDSVPLDLAHVVRFLTDDPERGGKKWEIALNQLPDGLLLVHKLFCPEHGADIQTMPGYKPDAMAKKHKRR